MSPASGGDVRKEHIFVKTKFLLGAIVVAVLAVFGVFGLQQQKAEASAFDHSGAVVLAVPSGSSAISMDHGMVNGPGLVDTSQKVAGFSDTMKVTMPNSATTDCMLATFSCTIVVSDKRLAGADNFNSVFGPRLDKLLPNVGASNAGPSTNSLLPFSGSLLTQPVNTSNALVPAPGDDARLDIRTRDSGLIGNPNAHVTVLIDPKALAALIGDPNTVRVKAPIDGARYPLGNNLNLSLPNSLIGVPNHVLTATITVVDSPASITVAAALTSLNCDNQGICSLSTKNSAGQNVFDRTRLALDTNFGGVIGGTMANLNDGSIANLKTSADHVGPYKVMVVSPLPVVQQGLLSYTSAHVRSLRDVTKSTFSTVPAAPSLATAPAAIDPRTGQGSTNTYQVNTPSSVPVNAPAPVTCSVTVCNGELVATQVKEASPACLTCGDNSWLLFAIPIAATLLGFSVLKLHGAGIPHNTGGGR